MKMYKTVNYSQVFDTQNIHHAGIPLLYIVLFITFCAKLQPLDIVVQYVYCFQFSQIGRFFVKCFLWIKTCQLIHFFVRTLS